MPPETANQKGPRRFSPGAFCAEKHQEFPSTRMTGMDGLAGGAGEPAASTGEGDDGAGISGGIGEEGCGIGATTGGVDTGAVTFGVSRLV